MRIQLLPSSLAAPDREQFLTSYLVGDAVAIDAGSLGFGLEASRQAEVRHVFLTHSHADHVCSLPIFLENAHAVEPGADTPCPTIHAGQAVLDCLTRDMFNDRVWPNLSRLASGSEPYARLDPLEPEATVEAEGLRLTPVAVNHVVPTLGYIVDDGASAVVFGADSGPVDRLWDLAAARPHLKAVFLEVTFPDELEELARITGHLTPTLFAREAAKVGPDVAVVAVHMRRRHRERIVRELDALGVRNLIIARPGVDYTF